MRVRCRSVSVDLDESPEVREFRAFSGSVNLHLIRVGLQDWLEDIGQEDRGEDDHDSDRENHVSFASESLRYCSANCSNSESSIAEFRPPQSSIERETIPEVECDDTEPEEDHSNRDPPESEVYSLSRRLDEHLIAIPGPEST